LNRIKNVRLQKEIWKGDLMSQYTFSYLNSEYERSPVQLRQKIDSIVSESSADPAAKALAAEIGEAFCEAISDIARYCKDQLKL
jgi:hypothetical protein